MTTDTTPIEAWLADHELVHGLGTEEAACTIAAINLALTGKLTDDIPGCMSEVIGRWIIPTQDRMSIEAINSPEWRRLIPLAAGTGRDHEPERLALVMDWMWERLALVQPIADERGFGEAWATMLRERTADAAYAATAYAATADAAYAAADAATDAAAAARAAAAAAYAAYAASVGGYHQSAIDLLTRLVAVSA